MPNYLQDEYDRINSPDYAQNQISERFRLANPALQRQLAGVRANLNQRGLFSSSPVTRSSNQAVSSLTNQISGDVFGGMEQRKMEIMQLLERRRQEELNRKQRSRAGLGGLLATGLSFIPGIGGLLGAGVNALGGGQGNGIAGSNYQTPSYNPGSLDFTR